MRLHSPIKWAILISLLLAVASVALYSPALHYQFSNLDDPGYVVENEHVKYGLDWDTVQWAFTTFDNTFWHPVTWLSHALDCHLYSLDAGKHHRTNVLLHAVNAVLLFWILLEATGYMGRSAMVAALFALHPINVESVVWISERKNVLSMMFFLLALGAYQWYASKPRVSRYSLVLLLYALGLMAKNQVITLPFVLLLWDYWPLRRMFAGGLEASVPVTTAAIPPKGLRWLLLEKVPLFILSAASAVITLEARRAGNMMNTLHPYPFVTRLGNAIVSYLRYIGKAFWPSHLAVVYPYPGNSIRTWQVVAGVLFLLATSTLVIMARRRRYLLVGWFWFVGTLVPMIGLVQVGVHGMADRYAYLPMVGLFIMICWSVADFAEERHISTAWLAGVSTAALLALTLIAHRQVGYWRDNVTLWSHTVQVTQGNWFAEEYLGASLLRTGQREDAMAHLRTAAAIYPQQAQIFFFMGTCEQERGNLQQAIEQYRKVISLTQNDIPTNAWLRYLAFKNLTEVYRNLGDTAHAWESFESAKSLFRQYNEKSRD